MPNDNVLMVPRDLLQDLIDDVSDYAASREFKTREKAWRDDVLARARTLLATPLPEPRVAGAIPRVHGVRRFADNPCTVLVMLMAEATDDALRAIHDRLACQSAPRAEVTDASAPDWMTCESRRPFAVNSIRARAEDLRDAERRCRAAFLKDFMGTPARYVADAYGEAAAVLEARLDAVYAASAGAD
ncbi:hypothetical protein [Burkholderia cenocepacia]|uniref:hypothetical protein n=1 Tax=Burkholderia cenocepacia TaxID=95486 RepID=UPI001C2509CE|nr:hypothetical protein [Burkholderia cenocepacia]MBU9656107.1 hypothetical protein [Burkholderia cenocepacia]